MQSIKSLLLGLCTLLTVYTTGSLSAAPVYLTGDYLYLPIQTTGVFIVGTNGGKFNPAGTGGASGVDFWFPGTPVYNFMVGVNGANYLNGSSSLVSGFATLTVSNASGGGLQRAVVNGVVTNGLSFTRDISFATNSKVIRIVDTLQNTGVSTLTNVVTLDTTDPDQDSTTTTSTGNDVVSVNLSNDLVVATGPTTGLSVGFGSDSGFQIPSAVGFDNSYAYSFLNVVDPEGSSGDVDINLAQNYGTLAAGQSKSVVWYILFGTSKAEVVNSFTLTNEAPVIQMQPNSQVARQGTNVTLCVAAAGSVPMSYQWRKDGTNLLDGIRISGATDQCLTFTGVREGDSGDYSVVITNSFGSVVSSNATLLVNALDHFTWNAITSPQAVGTPIPVTVTARDELGGVVSNFTGTVALSGAADGGWTTNNIMGPAVHTDSYSGDWTLGYSFTPNTNLVVTHVRHYFGSKVSIWTDSGTLLASQNVTSVPGTWVETPLATPIQLTAGTTYRVASQTAAHSYYYRYYWQPTFPNGRIVQNYETPGDGFPTSFSSVEWFVDLRYKVGTSVPVPLTPTNSGNFVSGVWAGNITVAAAMTNISLTAVDVAGNLGTSTNFDVLLSNDLSVSIEDRPDPVVVGAYLTNIIAVANSGPTTATGVTATNVLPASVTFVSAIASQGNCVLVSNRVECALGNLAGGATATISIISTPSLPGQITNSVTIGRAESDIEPANNSAQSVTTAFLPSLNVADVSVPEGDSGLTSAVFTVELSSVSPTNVTVSFATADGTAVAGSDYLSTNGVLVFTPGQTNQTVVVQVIGDTNSEPDESFVVNLSSPANAVLARTQAIGIITRDDLGGFFDAFEPNVEMLQWSTFGGSLGSTVLATNFGGSISGSNALWFGANTNRSAASRSLNTVSGGVVDFWLRIADGASSVWEMADLPGEGIVLEYSNDDGSSWVEFGRYDTSNYTNWTHVTVAIPLLAQIVDTQFRWRQLSHSGTGCDHWALDDVGVFTGPRPPVITKQPASQTVAEGYGASFAINVSGSLPISYFWLRDGAYIAGATNSTYRTNTVHVSDSGAQFSCLASNAYGTALSSNATMTVMPIGQLDFQISDLSTSNSKVVDHDSLTGDDRGGIAVSATQVFITGDYATARFNAGDLTGGTSLSRLDGLCSDLRSEKVYALGNGSSALSGGGTVTTLIELNEDTGAPTGVLLPLSQSFTISSGNGIFSGYGRVVVHNGTRVYDILLPSGVVTDLGTMVRPNWQFSESWSIWGVAEQFGGALYLAYRESGTQRIVRSRVADGLVTAVATFSNLSDMASFTVSPSRNRWYFHHEYSGQFGGSSETLGYADAQFIFINTNPPTIVRQPASQTVPSGYHATFSVGAFGSSPMSYSWLRDGNYIAGATNSTYTTNNVQLSDSGAQFSCLLSNAYGTVLTSNAMMTVVITPTDWFTEVFDGSSGYNDLAFRTLTFTPNGGVNFYDACEDLAAVFPTDPKGGTRLPLGSYSYAYLTLSNNISLYGQATNVIFLNSDGHVTLGSADNFGQATVDNHFSKPRVSASFAHLDPTAYGGTVSLLQLSNRVAITFDKVLDYESMVLNSFQIELFYDGRIRLTFLDIGTPMGLVGLSAGHGVPANFVTSDLSAYGSCGPQPPVIGVQPANQTVTVGYGASFSVAAGGSAPMSYFWLRNGEYIPDATDSTYGTDALQLSDSGTQFSCLVSNAFGTGLSSNAVLTVTLPPPFFDYSLYDQYLNEGDDLSATPSVTSETPLSFQWHHEGTNIPGATQQTLFLPNISLADAGYYSVTASNEGGSVTSDAFYLGVYQTAPTITSIPESAVALPGGYTILTVQARGSRPLTFQWQKDSYNLTGQTNASLRIANAAKNEGAYRVIVSNPLGVVASENIPFIIETDLSYWASTYGGNYRGLFYDGAGHYEPDGNFEFSIEHSNSGSFSLKVRRNGAFSGYLQLDGDRVPFGGKFSAYGAVDFKVSRAAFGKDPLSLSLALSPYDNSVTGFIASDKWKKDVSYDFAASLGGYRTVFSKTNQCALQGRYTINLDSVTDVPGFGSCCVKIEPNGNLMLSGNLADGTPIAQSVPVSQFGAFPLYVPLYPGPARTTTGHRYKGSVIGWVTIDTNWFPMIYGTINCRKEPNHKNAYYPNGFDFQTTAFGSSYLPPATNTSVLRLLNAVATFSQGNLETDFSQTAYLLDNHLVIAGIQNDTKINLENGRVVGSFVAPDGSRTNHFKAVIQQQYNGVFGQFVGSNSSGVFTVTNNVWNENP